MERYIIPSVYQAIQLCRTLGDAEYGMTSLALEEQLQLPRSSVFRLLKTLCSERLIEKRGTRYYLANGMYGIGGAAPRLQKFQRLLAAPLTALTGDTTHTAILCVPADNCAVAADVFCSNSHRLSAIRPGMQLSLTGSAPGHIMLAYHPRYRDENSLNIAELDSRRVMKLAAQTCTRGFAVSDAPAGRGQLVSVPVLASDGELLAMLCLELDEHHGDAELLSHWAGKLKPVAALPAATCTQNKKEAG